jgi:hypothetical protein
MALGDILARVLSLAAFILTLIVVFAGTQCGGLLEDVYIIIVRKYQLVTTTARSLTDHVYLARCIRAQNRS